MKAKTTALFCLLIATEMYAADTQIMTELDLDVSTGSGQVVRSHFVIGAGGRIRIEEGAVTTIVDPTVGTVTRFNQVRKEGFSFKLPKSTASPSRIVPGFQVLTDLGTKNEDGIVLKGTKSRGSIPQANGKVVVIEREDWYSEEFDLHLATTIKDQGGKVIGRTRSANIRRTALRDEQFQVPRDTKLFDTTRAK